MPSCVNVRAGSSGNDDWSEISNRKVTVPTLPVLAALDTTSVGLDDVIVCPPDGDCAVGAASVAGGVTTARCVTVMVAPATVIVPVRSAVVAFAATVN